MKYHVFIDGEAGTTGLKVAERLRVHPNVDLLKIETKNRKDLSARADLMAESDITILCLPDNAAIEAANLAKKSETRLIDASSAHRTNPDWVYGFPELQNGQSTAIKSAMRISNPGCYPTGFLALARPLILSGMLPKDSLLTVPAVSGYSGGGREMIDRATGDDFPSSFIYGVDLQHKHLAEMKFYSGLQTAPIFMPSVGNFFAGMLVHLPLHADQFERKVDASILYDLYAEWFLESDMVNMAFTSARIVDFPKVLSADAFAGRNDMEIFVFSNKENSHFWLIARFDNLGKGASGAAVQNMNIALGLEQTIGIC